MKQSTLRRREKQLLYLLKQAIEHTDEGVMITNANLKYPGPKIVYVNRALCEITGYTKKEFLGKSPRILQGPRTNSILLSKVVKNLQAGKPSYEYVINYRKDGSEIHMELDIAPILDENNKITHYISIQRDITSSIKKEIEKDEILGEFDHGMKTHLATIKGYLQLVEKKSADTKIAQYIHNADLEVDKILRLLLNIKDTRTKQTDTMTTQAEEFDIDTIIAQTIKNVRVMSKTHKIARRGKVNLSLQIDAFRISQVIEHLLKNAIKYSPNADKVIIHAKKDLRCVTISVEDAGPGVALEKQDKIFQSFYFSEPKENERKARRGFNLHLASEIIKAHGGIINVQSTPGKGTVFSFTLPLQNKNITELFNRTLSTQFTNDALIKGNHTREEIN